MVTKMLFNAFFLLIMSGFLLYQSYDCARQMEGDWSDGFKKHMKFLSWLIGICGVGCFGIAAYLAAEQLIGYVDRKYIIFAICGIMLCTWVMMYATMFQWRKTHKVFTDQVMYKPTPTRVMIVLASLAIMIIDMSVLALNYPGRL